MGKLGFRQEEPSLYSNGSVDIFLLGDDELMFTGDDIFIPVVKVKTINELKKFLETICVL